MGGATVATCFGDCVGNDFFVDTGDDRDGAMIGEAGRCGGGGRGGGGGEVVGATTFDFPALATPRTRPLAKRCAVI